LVEPVLGGVAFGIDPVAGRADRRVVTAVAGRPGPLVAGEVEGSRYVLDEKARVLRFDRNDGPVIKRRNLRRVAALTARAAEVFGGPQDIEWAIGRDEALWLLQSRPVTSENRGRPSGPLYGPGPVAETFPEALSELEQDLWVPPLREGIRHAVLLAGAGTRKQLARREIIVVLDGRVAMDLRLAGELVPTGSLVHRLNPMPGARKLRSAWRVGRLRGAVPHLAEDLLDRVDHDLEAVPALDALTSRQLIALLHRGRDMLRSLHAHEILMGMLTDRGCGRLTGASVALRVLAEARSDGLDDETILQRSPVVLALTAPEIRPATALPRGAVAPEVGQTCDPGSNSGVVREALRLRIRWIHELTGRAAWTIGERLRSAGTVAEADSIRHLSLDDVEAIVTRRAVTSPQLTVLHRHRWGDPLPACFQVSDRNRPIIVQRSDEVGGGTGAGGGVGSGPVTLDVADPPRGSVLVTRTLAPGLGPILPRLGGIVAETGSVLSHLAILARELGVPIVVGYPNATAIFPPGMVVSVDGASGDVTVVDEPS
jgi:pyruvate,water dikinase